MIRINLISVKEVRQQEDAIIQGTAMAVVIIAVLFAVILFNGIKEDEIARLQNRVDQTQAEIQRMDKIIGEVNRFTQTKKELEAKIQIIDQLRKGRSGPVRAMDELTRRIPSKVWLTEFEETDMAVSMVGLADSEEDVALFLSELERSDYFSNVVLGYTETDAQQKNLKKFTITCQVKYSL